jgi:hypothetical protein
LFCITLIKKFEEPEIWIIAAKAGNYTYLLTLNENCKQNFSLVGQSRKARGAVTDNKTVAINWDARESRLKTPEIATVGGNEVQLQLYSALNRQQVYG